jgi:hypothetical protein
LCAAAPHHLAFVRVSLSEWVLDPLYNAVTLLDVPLRGRPLSL